MKTTFHLLTVLLCTITFALASCGAGELNKNAVATANSFYSDLQKKDYAAAVSLCSDKAFETDTREAWINAMQKNNALLGAIKTFTKTTGFDISSSTSTGTLVTVAYDVQWQYGKSRDSIMLIKEKDGHMKVYNYHWQHQQAKYLTEVDESEKQAVQYMDAVKAGNYDAALNLCSDEALKITPRQNWKAFLDKANGTMGAVTAYNIMKDSSYYNIDAKGESGPGNYYDIFVVSKRGINDVKEKIIFFQKNYEAPVKLVGHVFL